MKKTDRILVTGASGFIGSHVLRTLFEKGYKNLRSTTYSRTLRKDFYGWETVENHHGDLRTAEFCEKITREVDVVIHCAANTSNALDTKFNPLLHVTPNVEMNTNLMEQSWKNKVTKFMFISSNTVYPDMGLDYCREEADVQGTPLIPVYKAVGGMKRYTESLCDFFSNQIHEPMQCIMIRPSNAFGPNDKFDYEKCHVTPASIRKVADGLNPIPVWGDGSDVRDLLYVEDMADGIVFLTENVDTYDKFNVCYGQGFTVNEVLAMLKEIDHNDNPIEYVNNKAFMISVRLLSSEKINQLGWKPKYQLREALEKAMNWYKANKGQYNPESKP
jgi:GDP-L-fucose synthase